MGHVAHRVQSACMRVGLTAVVLLLCVSPGYSQGSGANSKLTGQVLDATGAVMPNVAVEIEEVSTGAKRTALSSSDGYYTSSSSRRGSTNWPRAPQVSRRLSFRPSTSRSARWRI